MHSVHVGLCHVVFAACNTVNARVPNFARVQDFTCFSFGTGFRHCITIIVVKETCVG